MRYDRERKVFIAGPHEWPVKRYVAEEYTYPSDSFLGGRELTQYTRQVIVEFENRWALSIIWGSLTYSDNHDHPWGLGALGQRVLIYPEFVEEPGCVEVGVLSPVPKTIPVQTFGPLPATGYTTEIPEHEVTLWGDPLGYVDAADLRLIADSIGGFDSDGHPWPEEGPYITEVDGRRVFALLPSLEEG